MEDLPTGERRLGRRHVVANLPVTWHFEAPAAGRGARLRRRRESGPTSATGVITQISVTGGRVTLPANMPIEPGIEASMTIGGHEMGVLVERCDPTNDPGTVLTGVQFIGSTPEFVEFVYRCFADTDPSTPAPEIRA